MKKVISGILCTLILVLGVVSAHATSINETDTDQSQVRSLYINTTTTTLSISGGQAICEGLVVGYSGTTTKVTIALYLERKLASSSTWLPFANGSKSFDNYYGAYQLKVPVDKGYQYRVRAVYTAYSGKNSESLTAYSGVVAY